MIDPAKVQVALINSDGKVSPPLPDPQDVLTTLHELRFRVMARTPYEHLFTELGTLDAAEAALAAGCDSIFVDTFGDYAVERIRALTDVPVVGAGEEGIRAAGEYAAFSIVTVWPASMRFLYDERLATTPGGERCRGMHHLSNESELDKVGTDTGVKARMMRGEGGVLQELVSLCQQAVAADGSEAVLLGCTCMAPVAFELERRLDFAVLDPSRIGLVAAHAAARTHRGRAADGRAPSAVRHTGLARRLVSDHLAAQESQALALDDCEVCVVTPGSALESERQG